MPSRAGFKRLRLMNVEHLFPVLFSRETLWHNVRKFCHCVTPGRFIVSLFSPTPNDDGAFRAGLRRVKGSSGKNFIRHFFPNVFVLAAFPVSNSKCLLGGFRRDWTEKQKFSSLLFLAAGLLSILLALHPSHFLLIDLSTQTHTRRVSMAQMCSIACLASRAQRNLNPLFCDHLAPTVV